MSFRSMVNRLKVYFPGVEPDRVGIELYEALREPPVPPPSDVWGKRFAPIFGDADRYFCRVDANDADVAVYPYRFDGSPVSVAAMDDARRHGLPFIATSWGDDYAAIDLPYGSLFRQSILRSRRSEREFAIPAYCVDSLEGVPVERYIRTKGAKPLAGFCGYCGTGWLRLMYRLTGRRRKVDGLSLRVELLRRLQTSPRIDAIVVPQTKFLGGAKGAISDDPDHARRVRKQFLDNVLNTGYTLCVRGAGNFSYRFYEVLAAGRIPIFVDTDCVLPFEEIIPWRKHCVWVPLADMDRIADIVADFHASLSEKQFMDLQAANRALWQEYLHPTAFWRHALTLARDARRAPVAGTDRPR